MHRMTMVEAGHAAFASGGPVRRVRVRLCDRTPVDADNLDRLDLLTAALIGVAIGVVSSDPSLFLGWLR
jgi:hypothetical protein